MIHLPPTGHEVLGSKLQLFNLHTTAPTDKTIEYRSFGHILSLRKQKLKFPVNNIRNGGLQPAQSSPMGPNFFLAATWSIYASNWAHEPGRLLLKGQKPENRRRSTGFWYGTSIYCFLGTFWCTSTAMKCGGESEINDDLYYEAYPIRSQPNVQSKFIQVPVPVEPELGKIYWY